MSFIEEFRHHLDAGCAGMWVQTAEPHEALASIYRACAERQIPRTKFFAWDADTKWRSTVSLDKSDDMPPPKAIRTLFSHIVPNEQSAVLALPNFHKFLQNPEVLQALVNAIVQGKSVGAHYVILSPGVNIPEELQTYVSLIHDTLPSHAELQEVVNETLKRDRAREVQKTTLEALSGMTRLEAETALSLAVAREDNVTARSLWNAKAKVLEKGRLLTLHKGVATFKDIGGMESLKDFTARSLRPGRKRNPKGVCLLGPTGTGKSLFAKCLGNEVGRVTLCLKIGNLLGSLVGQSENNLRTALMQAEAMAPCVLFVDEIEKDLSGVGSGNDSGVMSRIFGNLLTWRNDTTADVYMIVTANNVETIPPEFLRPGRFDATFMIDLPSELERRKIWDHHLKQYEVAEDVIPESRDWTGAEIEQCCYLASELDYTLAEAAQKVPTVMRRAPSSVQKVREFASGWALSASNDGVYHHNSLSGVTSRRQMGGKQNGGLDL